MTKPRLSNVRIEAKESKVIHWMPLRLSALLPREVIGIYGDNKNELPLRMRFLAPDAAKSFRTALSPAGIVVSDMFRSAEASLRARKTRKGSQRPAYSGHNYGYSIDLDIGRSMKALGVNTKKALDDFMAENDWLCHRRDHRREFEGWHYNHHILGYVQNSDPRTSSALERKITDVYGRWWSEMTDMDLQLALQKLGLYGGDLDGVIGPITREAIGAFQRAWLLQPSKSPTVQTKRTLAYITAEKDVS